MFYCISKCISVQRVDRFLPMITILEYRAMIIRSRCTPRGRQGPAAATCNVNGLEGSGPTSCLHRIGRILRNHAPLLRREIDFQTRTVDISRIVPRHGFNRFCFVRRVCRCRSLPRENIVYTKCLGTFLFRLSNDLVHP